MTKLFASRSIAAIVAAGVALGLAGAAEAQVVRDHRGQKDRQYTPAPGSGQPVIRDHRKPLTFCFGVFSTTCQNLRPQYNPGPR